MKTGTYGITIAETIFDHETINPENTDFFDLERPNDSLLRNVMAYEIFKAWIVKNGGLTDGEYDLQWETKKSKIHARLNRVI